MQNLPILPDAITAIAPILAAALAGWIGQAHFPAWANALIALVVLVAVSVVCVLIGARFTGNVAIDITIVLTYATALMYGPFRVIQKYLILGPSSQLPSVRVSLPEKPGLRAEPSIPDRAGVQHVKEEEQTESPSDD